MSSSTYSRLGLLLWMLALALASPQAQTPQEPATATALPPAYTGKDIFELACSTCHGVDGRGSPRSTVGFDVELPDFTDCSFATPEPFADWFAVVHDGGPIRGLDRHMPAFGDALSADDIGKVIAHLWTFCSDPGWPRGDLNLPRTFFIEKAFPENEIIFTTAIAARGETSIAGEVLYEKRFGVRNQIEVAVPVDVQRNSDAAWSRGLGDVAVAFKRTLYASLDTGRIFSAGGEIVVPTGKESAGLGRGFTMYEPFALFGQVLPRSMFLQAQAGIEIPSDHRRGTFNGDGDRVQYVVAVPGTDGPFDIEVELRYQPIGFRWAQNLRRYDAAEPQPFVSFYDAMSASSSTVLARATAVVR